MRIEIKSFAQTIDLCPVNGYFHKSDLQLLSNIEQLYIKGPDKITKNMFSEQDAQADCMVENQSDVLLQYSFIYN